MQKRVAVIVFSREQKYIQILNWNRETQTVTFRDTKDNFIDNTVPPKTAKLRIKNNLVILGDCTFNRQYLKKIKNADKVS